MEANKMKIKELIKVLNKYPQDMDIMVLADEFACYYTLEKRRIKKKTLLLGHTAMDVRRLKRCEHPGPPRWREKHQFFGECDIKDKRNILVIQ